MKVKRYFNIAILLFFISCIGMSPTRTDSDIKNKWYVYGPLKVPEAINSWGHLKFFHKDFALHMGGEADFDPLKNSKNTRSKWQSIAMIDGKIDLEKYYSEYANSVVYLYSEFDSGQAGEIVLKINGQNGLKIYCNGEPVFSYISEPAFLPEDLAVIVPVKNGKNRILFKLLKPYKGNVFSCQMTTLEHEQTQWNQVKKTEVQILPAEMFVFKPEKFSCTVMTKPAIAVKEPIEMDFYDQEGKKLFTRKGTTSKSMDVPFPEDYKGIVKIRVTGLKNNDWIKAEQFILMNEHRTSEKQMCRDIARFALSWAENLKLSEENKVFIDSFQYFARILEEKMHSSMTKLSWQIQAIKGIIKTANLMNTKKDRLSVFHGLNQWAYQSAIDSTYQPYSLYVPASYDPGKEYALLVHIHGYNGWGYAALHGQFTLNSVQPDDFIVVAPFGRGNISYLSAGEQDVFDILHKMKSTFNIDPQRIYLSGHSMGGFGTMHLGIKYPDQFAVIAPFAGGLMHGYLDNLNNTHVMVVHGDNDPSVPVNRSRQIVEGLKKLKYNYNYYELAGTGHSAVKDFFTHTTSRRMFEYLRQYKRNPWPGEVILTADMSRYGKSFWINILDFAYSDKKGKVTAKIMSGNTIEIKTKDIKVFSIDMAHPELKETKVQIQIDGKKLIAENKGKIVYLVKNENQWKIDNNKKPDKRTVRHYGDGLQGVFYRPLLIVYGTLQEEKKLKTVADILADWSPDIRTQYGYRSGRYLVKADIDVRDEDMKNYDLVLVGNPQQNKISAGIAAQLPVDFRKNKIVVNNREYTEVGLNLTCPNPLNPQKLISLISLPPDSGKDEDLKNAMVDLVRNLKFSNRKQSEWHIGFLKFPDVILFKTLDLKTKPLLKASFDYRWENLEVIP